MILLDNSAWSRIVSGAVPPQRREELARLSKDPGLAVSVPFLLEAGYSARGVAHHRELMKRLGAYPRLEIDDHVEALALVAQGELAAGGHHRLPPTDLLIAAIATRHGAAVLHYDKDYDILAGRTSLDFESIWLAPRSSL